jgi:hypothetical protein
VKISPFFHDLRSAYQAEIDDLTQDSEGKDVLRKRLAQKRSEMGFLVNMMDVAPEMVAVVFHQGFRFGRTAALEQAVAAGQDDLPEWAALAGSVTLEPWAATLAQTVLAQPGGERFMVVAAGLEYLLQARFNAGAHSGDDADESNGDDDGDAPEHDDDYDALSADDAADPLNSRSREEASSNWLADIGFERKD